MEAHTAKEDAPQDGSDASEEFCIRDHCNGIHMICDAIQMAQKDRGRNMRYLLIMTRLRLLGRFPLTHAVLAFAFQAWSEVAEALGEVSVFEDNSSRRRKIMRLHETFKQLLADPFPEDWDEAMEWSEQVEKMFATFYRTKLGHWRRL